MPPAIPFIRDTALARKITVVLLIKIVFLTVIWALWFSHPETEDMSLPKEKVVERLLAPAGDDT